jgi:hypothetical protein
VTGARISGSGLATSDEEVRISSCGLKEGPVRSTVQSETGVDEAIWPRGCGLALSIGLTALPDYLKTNREMVQMARFMIDAVLEDHEYGR